MLSRLVNGLLIILLELCLGKNKKYQEGLLFLLVMIKKKPVSIYVATILLVGCSFRGRIDVMFTI